MENHIDTTQLHAWLKKIKLDDKTHIIRWENFIALSVDIVSSDTFSLEKFDEWYGVVIYTLPRSYSEDHPLIPGFQTCFLSPKEEGILQDVFLHCTVTHFYNCDELSSDLKDNYEWEEHYNMHVNTTATYVSDDMASTYKRIVSNVLRRIQHAISTC